ncbi:unnamed protein product [Heligmosomoides polygyrus]|uniref:SCP domain-containing protein n=1 Tax=Heligmosomoides polygyrus TaxID=6339 RepID=A0A3P7XU79_HELPZ|nr:unnamed protein product [Heligmosomoides polygyrus]
MTASSATTCTSSTGVTDAARTAALDAINQNRRTAVNGQLQNGANAGTNLPHGKDMYKLDWDCGLEGLAEVLLPSDCSVPATTLPNNGIGSATVATPPSMDDIFTQGIATWPQLLTANALDQPAYGAPMIQGKTTKVGCSARKCTTPDQGLLVCVYNQPVQRLLRNAQLTLRRLATLIPVFAWWPMQQQQQHQQLLQQQQLLVLQLCFLVEVGTNSRCTQNTGMTDELRFLFRDMHNYRRSQTALGKTVKNTGRYLPSSSNMQYMVVDFSLKEGGPDRYNCGLEATAIQLAGTCPAPSIQAGRLIGQVAIGTYTFTSATQEVCEKLIYIRMRTIIVKSWWRVVRQVSGPGMQVTFRAQHVGTPIASFTQMAWAATRKLGCAVARCPTVYVAVCNYDPSGNVVGQQIYTPGTPCTACAAGSTCNPSEALCTLP